MLAQSVEYTDGKIGPDYLRDFYTYKAKEQDGSTPSDNDALLKVFDEYNVEFNALTPIEISNGAIVYKENSENKKIKLDILFKTGESINTYSDNLGKKFHLLDYITTNNCGIGHN